MSFNPRGALGGCTVHHLVWFRPAPTAAILAIGCAHCQLITRHMDMTETCTNEQVDAFADDSARQHQRLCDKQQARERRRKFAKEPADRPASRR